MKKIIALAALAAMVWLMNPAFAAGTPSPPSAFCYIGYPNDGQTLPAGKPFRVWFGLRNMGVAPKGVNYPNTRPPPPADRYRFAAARSGDPFRS
jgi:hypothetical protein